MNTQITTRPAKVEFREMTNEQLRERGRQNFWRMMNGEPYDEPVAPQEWAGWSAARRMITGDWTFI